MSIFHAIVLGIVQGLTEFLPISSSGHLVLVPWLFGWEDPGLTFDVALHLGTLVAVIVYFWRDLTELVMAGLISIKDRSMAGPKAKLAWLLVAATIPGAIIGYLGNDWFETNVRQPILIGILIMAFGGVMYVADRYGRKDRDLDRLSWLDGILIGFSQALALFPGVSRSGATISAGLWRGLSREAAARFSFLLAIPIMVGAVIFKLSDLISDGVPAGEQMAFAAGIIASALTGFLAIGWLLGYVRKQPLTIFIVYRFVIGIVIILLALIRG